MKVLWNFRESLVIWSVWLTLVTAREILVKSQKPLDGTKVVFNCEIKDTEKEIVWKNQCDSEINYFECSPPYSAGICKDNKPDPRYEFNIKQSKNGLVSSVTIRRFDIDKDKDLVCEHNDLCISYLSTNSNGEYPVQEIGYTDLYENGAPLVDPCSDDYFNGSFYVLEGGERGHLYSSDDNVTLKCSHTAVGCFSHYTRLVIKEIDVDCGIPVMESPGDVEATVGDDIHFVVNISGMEIDESNVKWYKSYKGQERELTSNFRIHRFMNTTIAMVAIYDVQVIDSGKYKADITKNDGTLMPKTFKLTVKDNLSTALGFGVGIGVGICLGFLTGCAVIVGGWFVWRWRKSKG